VTALVAQGAGKRYARTWALRDCTLAIPSGRVVALVGPNGAGKSTLLNLAVGLTEPTAGRVRVLDDVAPGSQPALDRIAFVAQDTPLYANLSVADTLRLVASLSRGWDEANARNRLSQLDIPLRRKVGKLSGGQHAQVALAVALARHPELLILDEPVARLDPLARHDFMAALMTAVADEGLSVLLSSHVVAELEKVCDYLVVLSRGQVQVVGDVDELLAEHRLLSGPSGELDAVAQRHDVVHAQTAERQARLLVRMTRPVPTPVGWHVGETNLEELVLSYLRAPQATALPGPVSERRAVSA
jgi:ABC-2 type transport system ATP-binding protein